MYWYVCDYYNGVCIVIFVCVMQSNCWLYLILGTLSYVSPVCGLFFQCIVIKFTFVLIFLWILNLCLLWYFCVLHKICSLVVLYIGNISMHISCILFVIPFSPSFLTYIHNSIWTCIFLNYFSHTLKHISLLLVYQYLINLFLL